MATYKTKYSPLRIPFTVGQPYGNPSTRYSCGFHTGVDIPASLTGQSNPDLYSLTDNGTVVYVYNGSAGQHQGLALGNQVQILDNRTGLYYRYCHMVQNSIGVTIGQTVNLSTYIGKMGMSGNADGVHLHLEATKTQAWNCSNFVDPCSPLGFPNTRGTVVEYDGEAPTPTPPEPPSPEEPTYGDVYERESQFGKYYGTLEGFTNSLTSKQKDVNALYIWQYLQTYGWTLESASVLIGAFEIVSDLNPGYWKTNSTDSPYGLLGWRYWEMADWVHEGGEWVYNSSDLSIIDNSIGRICWYRQYNLAWNDIEMNFETFSKSELPTDRLSEVFHENYAYIDFLISIDLVNLKNRSTYWYKFLKKGKRGNSWAFMYSKKYLFLE